MEKKRLIFYALGIIVLSCIVFLPGYSKLEKLREDNRNYIKRIELLENQNKKLEDELGKLQEDPVYVEKKAREKLGIVRKGEQIYRKSE